MNNYKIYKILTISLLVIAVSPVQCMKNIEHLQLMELKKLLPDRLLQEITQVERVLLKAKQRDKPLKQKLQQKQLRILITINNLKKRLYHLKHQKQLTTEHKTQLKEATVNTIQQKREKLERIREKLDKPMDTNEDELNSLIPIVASQRSAGSWRLHLSLSSNITRLPSTIKKRIFALEKKIENLKQKIEKAPSLLVINTVSSQLPKIKKRLQLRLQQTIIHAIASKIMNTTHINLQQNFNEAIEKYKADLKMIIETLNRQQAHQQAIMHRQTQLILIKQRLQELPLEKLKVEKQNILREKEDLQKMSQFILIKPEVKSLIIEVEQILEKIIKEKEELLLQKQKLIKLPLNELLQRQQKIQRRIRLNSPGSRGPLSLAPEAKTPYLVAHAWYINTLKKDDRFFKQLEQEEKLIESAIEEKKRLLQMQNIITRVEKKQKQLAEQFWKRMEPILRQQEQLIIEQIPERMAEHYRQALKNQKRRITPGKQQQQITRKRKLIDKLLKIQQQQQQYQIIEQIPEATRKKMAERHRQALKNQQRRIIPGPRQQQITRNMQQVTQKQRLLTLIDKPVVEVPREKRIASRKRKRKTQTVDQDSENMHKRKKRRKN